MKKLQLLFLLIAHAFSQIVPSPLAINWTMVSQVSSILNYNQDFGQCICDLTRYSCDANCCCDTDCSKAELSTFKGGCLLESSQGNASQIPFCSDQLVSVNVRNGIMVSVYKQGINSATCVLLSNSASKGTFYGNPGSFVTEATFLNRYGLKEFPIESSSNSIGNVLLNSQNYMTGDAIKVSYVDAGLSGAFGFIRAFDSGECNPNSNAKFGISESSSCNYYFTTGAVSCASGTLLDANYYTTGFRVLKTPSSSVSITVTQGTTTCYDATTGVTTTCALSAPSWDALTSRCSNAVHKISWTVTYSVSASGGVSIESIVADTILVNIPVTNYAGTSLEFSISFVENDVAYTPILKSGNPGYLIGKPVLAGSVTSNNGVNAIQQYSDPLYGLSLASDFVAPGAASITCSGLSDKSHRMPVLFGQAMHSYCTMYYTLSDLTNNCASIRSNIYTIQTLTASSLTHIGKFGNTSFLNYEDWIPIINNVPQSLTGNIAIVEPLAGTCSSILTEFNIEFLTAKFGSTTNPQTGIVGARYSYTSGSISYRCLNSLDCIRPSDLISGGSNIPGTVAQAFRIKSTVSFVPVADDPSLVVPSPPRLIPPLPNDIFYPFSL